MQQESKGNLTRLWGRGLANCKCLIYEMWARGSVNLSCHNEEYGRRIHRPHAFRSPKKEAETRELYGLSHHAWPHPLREKRQRSIVVDRMYSRLDGAPLSFGLLVNVIFRYFNSADAYEQHGVGRVCEESLQLGDIAPAERLNFLAFGLAAAMVAHGPGAEGLFALGHDARTDSKMERVWIDSRRLGAHTAIATALLCRLGQWASSCSCLAEMLNDEVLGARAVRDYLAHDSGLHGVAQYWTKYFYDDLAANVSHALRNVCIVGAGSQEFLAFLFPRSQHSLDSQVTLLCGFLNGIGRTIAYPLYNSWRRCLGADGTLACGEV